MRKTRGGTTTSTADGWARCHTRSEEGGRENDVRRLHLECVRRPRAYVA